jgi:hypothetical protein
MPKCLCGTSFISVSIASMRETAKMLAITPETVATMAKPTVVQMPHCPNAGRAASASE